MIKNGNKEKRGGMYDGTSKHQTLHPNKKSLGQTSDPGQRGALTRGERTPLQNGHPAERPPCRMIIIGEGDCTVHKKKAGS